MWVRLTRRLANTIDGVSLSAHQIGEVFEVTRHEAELLVAEAWAVVVTPRAHRFQSRTAPKFSTAKADERRRVPMAEQVRDIGEHIHQRLFQPQNHRRAEDRIREEWHDEHATVINDRDTSR
jgi:hypothetical protein